MRWSAPSLYAVSVSEIPRLDVLWSNFCIVWFISSGPFRLVNPSLNVTQGAGGKFYLLFCSISLLNFPGDFDILVDDDGTGYIVYSANYYMRVEQLTPDFYYSTGKSYKFDEYFVEAPVLMKKNNIYYALFD